MKIAGSLAYKKLKYDIKKSRKIEGTVLHRTTTEGTNET
jgi:hypothetical protein